MPKAVLLDRDGTINVDKHYVHKIEDFNFIPGAIDALKLMQDKGYLLFILTNQSGIGRGLYPLEDYKRLRSHVHKLLKEKGITIQKEYFCPHSPQKGCECRKPGTLLIQRAIKEFNIDPTNSYMIGDKTSDIEAGRREGLHTILVMTGKAGKDGQYDADPEEICDTLLDAAHSLK